MEKNESASLKFSIVLKEENVFSGCNLQSCMAGYVRLYFKDLRWYYWKKVTLTIIFDKYK